MTNSNILLSSYSLSDLEAVFRDCIKTELETLKPQNPPSDDDLITENEAKQILLVSKVTLKKWRDEGRIKFFRIGTRIRYRKTDLLNALERKKIGRVK